MADQQHPIAAIAKNRGSEVRLALTVFRDARLVDLRTYLATDETGELRPSKKGVSLKVESLRPLREALAAADAQAVARGWLEAEVTP